MSQFKRGTKGEKKIKGQSETGKRKKKQLFQTVFQEAQWPSAPVGKSTKNARQHGLRGLGGGGGGWGGGGGGGVGFWVGWFLVGGDWRLGGVGVVCGARGGGGGGVLV